MVDYLIHFYRKGTPPFRSLSALRRDEALAIMKELYVEGSVFWERFKDPGEYRLFRERVETELYNGFVSKGGAPRDRYPIYLVLGRPKWTLLVKDEATVATTDEIHVPLSIIPPEQISFTYPDSMVSALMTTMKNPDYYEPEYHGKVFTLSEITEIVGIKGLPGEEWQTRMPAHFAHYIEAQVWNRDLLLDYLASAAPGDDRRGHGSRSRAAD